MQGILDAVWTHLLPAMTATTVAASPVADQLGAAVLEARGAVGGHGAEMRISIESEAVAAHAPPMNPDVIQRFAAIAELHPGILVENKGYSLALHFRKAPDVERAIYDRVSAIRADLPNAEGKRIALVTGTRMAPVFEPMIARFNAERGALAEVIGVQTQSVPVLAARALERFRVAYAGRRM